LLHAVDDGKLGGPFIGLGQQALRLIEEPGILEGDAEASRQRAQEADVALGECIGAVQVLERDSTTNVPATHQRRNQDRL
jgi:hypothetical protein